MEHDNFARWLDKELAKPRIELWVVEPDEPLRVLYTDGEKEEIALERACFADRQGFARSPTTRDGVYRYDFEPEWRRVAADEVTCRAIAKMVTHNRKHGSLRKAGGREEVERF